MTREICPSSFHKGYFLRNSLLESFDAIPR